MYNNYLCPIEKDTVLGNALESPRMNKLCFISEYIYQSIIFEEIYPEVSELYNKLAMDEMTHYKALSELQYRLGVNPTIKLKLINSEINLREDRDSIAPRALLRSLRHFIRAELTSAEEYRNLSTMSSNSSVSNQLLNIADDEEEHAHLLSEIECTVVTN